MLARLLKSGDEIVLMFRNGEICPMDENSLHMFFLRADLLAEKRFDMLPHLNASLNKESCKVLALIDKERRLIINDMDFFRSVMASNSEFLTAEEYGVLHGKKRGIIMKLCRERRLPGAIKKGDVWLIPKDCPYPKDARVGVRVKPLY